MHGGDSPAGIESGAGGTLFVLDLFEKWGSKRRLVVDSTNINDAAKPAAYTVVSLADPIQPYEFDKITLLGMSFMSKLQILTSFSYLR